MAIAKAVISGLLGATILNIIHQSAARITPDDAPRMDALGERAIAKGLELGGKPSHRGTPCSPSR